MDHQCKYEEDIGYIKAKLDHIDERINGSFDVMTRHIEEGVTYRNMLVSHDVKIKMIVGFFLTVNLAIAGALVRLFIK